MRARKPTGMICVAAALAACICAYGGDAPPAPPKTIKDLEKHKVEIRVEGPAQASVSRAMENYRKFLDLQRTDPERRAEALRRLGDLSLESGELERLESEVTRVDLGGAEAIRLYGTLLKVYPDYQRNDQVLYQLARAYETTGQPEKALATLDEVVRRYPMSRDIAEVQFRRGEILFSAQRYREAESAYGIGVKAGSGSQFYQQSLYKQGWSMFKQALNEECLPVFAKLLDVKLIDRNRPGTLVHMDSLGRADRELVDDTLRVMSVTLSYLDGTRPLDDFVTKIGNPPYSALLYARLGDLYVEKQRYQDAATTYRAFVNRDPDNEFSPGLAMQAIEAYRKGGFAQLVLDGKRDYVEHYNFDAPFWKGRDRKQYASVVAELKTNLADVAAYYHASAQKTRRTEDYQQAARWYRAELASFPEDPESSHTNYLLAEALYESGQYAGAVDEYERTAYDYAGAVDAPAAGYAALNAYQKREEQLSPAERPQWHRRAIDSGVKFAQAFPAHPDSTGVLTRGAQDLYAAKDLPRAIQVSDLLLAHEPKADAAQRRIAYSIIGQASFDTGAFERAESAWSQARELTGPNDAERKNLDEQLATAVYRQAEAKRTAGDDVEAAKDFLRVATVSPNSSIRATSQYDAAAALITAKQWPQAIDVLEGYRRDYPKSELQSEVTQKLAVAYAEAGRPAQAAAEYERIAQRPGETAEIRQEALATAADLYQKSGDNAHTVSLLERLVAEYPTPVAERIETRQRLVDLAAAAGNIERQRHWQHEIVASDAKAGAARTNRTRYLAARAQLALAEPARDAFRAIRLTSPLKQSLTAKRKALEAALQGYREAADYAVAEVTTRATFEMADLYQRLAADLLASDRPKGMNADELEQYDLLLEEQAIPFEEQAIKLHEANFARVSDGIYDDAVHDSFLALVKLVPGRYAKSEVQGKFLTSMNLPTPAVSDPPEPSEALQAAVAQAEKGDVTEAELAFKELAAAEGRPAGPLYDLGLLTRKANRLDESASALREAVDRSPASALPWNELGLTLRAQGRYADARQAYAKALDLDPQLAPAWRNKGVLEDLYLGNPSEALQAFEHYKALAGEDKMVNGWIAELHQRVEKSTPNKTEAQPTGATP